MFVEWVLPYVLGSEMYYKNKKCISIRYLVNLKIVADTDTKNSTKASVAAMVKLYWMS